MPARKVPETLAFGLLIALGIAMFVSPLASAWPDGLEKVAETLGFAERTVETPLVPSPMPDYAIPGIVSATWATALAGGVGTVVVFLLALGLARILVGRRPGARRSPVGVGSTMRHDFFDRYSRLDSPIHRLPAGLKLAAALGVGNRDRVAPRGCLGALRHDRAALAADRRA